MLSYAPNVRSGSRARGLPRAGSGGGGGSARWRVLELRLKDLGCPKLNAIIRDENRDAPGFWRAIGYEVAPTRQFGKEL